VGPAVVRIDSTRTVITQAPRVFNDPFFQQFFGFGQAPPSKEVLRGIGSGFIINSKGQILTNAHVVNGVNTVNVTLKDGRTFKGQVLGEDPVTDVAVVKIPANNLPSVTLGNSTALQPGDWTIAIGNPLGLNNTVTSGIISATSRASTEIGVSHDPVNFIQTDAAINPGNSGGPLLDANGQVIGINTAIIKGAQGLGFAIPINTAQGIAQQLITKGKVEHPYLGIEMATLTPEVKQLLNNSSNGQINVTANQGVIVVRVRSNSPSAQAGLQPGDVIQKINNQPVTTAEEVQRLVENSQVGSQLQMTVQHDGQSRQVGVRTVPLPPQLASPQG
jgi:S1-C subfamily serine protease